MNRHPVTLAHVHANSAEEFWSQMCHPRFVRLSLHYGRIGETIIYCAAYPPEHRPGFIESKMAGMAKDLALDEFTRPLLRERLKAFFTKRSIHGTEV